MAFGQAYKSSGGGGETSTTITVNVSGVIEHDSPNGKKSISAKELYDSDPQMFGQFMKATMSKTDFGSGNYIVDFYCLKLNLVIEVDGNSHFFEESVVEDLERQNVLERMGVYFLRFSDLEVKRSMPSVLDEIGYFINDFEGKMAKNPPSPL